MIKFKGIFFTQAAYDAASGLGQQFAINHRELNDSPMKHSRRRAAYGYGNSAFQAAMIIQ
ncbi:hypothetical protein LJC06_00820 [Bacteroidales bacterium OttesenSCG-928-I14]|nr:hypothetical protein [Bacteroidales bacterium OttesenSCG-928-I14]